MAEEFYTCGLVRSDEDDWNECRDVRHGQFEKLDLGSLEECKMIFAYFEMDENKMVYEDIACCLDLCQKSTLRLRLRQSKS